MTFVRQPAAIAARRRAERTIKAVAPLRTAKPMTIHSQIGPAPDPFAGAVALALGCAAGAGAAELAGADDAADGTLPAGEEVPSAGEELTALGEELTALGAALTDLLGARLGVLPGERLTAWLGDRLAIALLMLVPHAVAMPAAMRIVTARSRRFSHRRIPGPFPRYRPARRPVEQSCGRRTPPPAGEPSARQAGRVREA